MALQVWPRSDRLAPVGVKAVPCLIQLPPNAPGKAADDG